jgi:hypothetical protein
VESISFFGRLLLDGLGGVSGSYLSTKFLGNIPLLGPRRIGIFAIVPVLVFLFGDRNDLAIGKVKIIVMRRGIVIDGFDFERWSRHLLSVLNVRACLLDLRPGSEIGVEEPAPLNSMESPRSQE